MIWRDEFTSVIEFLALGIGHLLAVNLAVGNRGLMAGDRELESITGA